jgi:hypothetical protein
MASKIKVDELETVDGTGTIALQNQISGMTSASMPTGSMLQVVNAKTNTQVSMSSATLTDTGLTATITPSSTSSKILVLLHQNGVRKNSNHVNNDVRIELQRGGTLIHLPCTYAGFVSGGSDSVLASVSTSYLDSPSSTSAVVYKTQFKNPDGGGAGGTILVQESSAESTITLLEIAG